MNDYEEWLNENGYEESLMQWGVFITRKDHKHFDSGFPALSPMEIFKSAILYSKNKKDNQ